MADEEATVEKTTEEQPAATEETAEQQVEESAEPKSEEVVSEEVVDEKKASRPAPPLEEGTLFIWGTGRRKASVARVRIRPGEGNFQINKRELENYFYSLKHQQKAVAPLETAGMMGSYDVSVNVQGGGKTGQAEAVSLGLARAISKHVPDVEHALRDKGLLTRDSRAKERKKPGQPGARKRFQFSKR